MTSPTGRPNADRKRRAGFTLIELILVMALLVVLIGLVSPSLSRFFHGRNLDSEARRMLALTRHAQGRSASEGIPMRLWIDPVRRTYGLSGEYGGATADNSALNYALGPDLRIQVYDDFRGTTPRQRVSTTASDGSSMAIGIRFLPDGTIDETSPSRIRIHESEERQAQSPSGNRGIDEVWITTDIHRIRYEIVTNIYSTTLQ